MSSTSLLIVICCFAPLGVCVGQVNHFHLHRRPDTTAMAASSCRTCALAGPSCIWAVCSGTLSLFVVGILLPWFGWCGSFTIPPPLPSTISILVLYSPWQPLHSGCSAIHLRCWYDLVVAAHRYRIMIYSYDFYPSSFFVSLMSAWILLLLPFATCLQFLGDSFKIYGQRRRLLEVVWRVHWWLKE